jgi:hypothetical protein
MHRSRQENLACSASPIPSDAVISVVPRIKTELLYPSTNCLLLFVLVLSAALLVLVLDSPA